MELITSYSADGILYLMPHGRIDSSNSSEAEKIIGQIVADSSDGSVVINAEELEYISSAGLRVILRLRKLRPELKIEGASSEVYGILEMTGFTEMMPVEKAYRRLSVEGCEVIGRGSNGEVYRLDPDTIIKVYLNPDALPDIHRERELARRAFVLGIPTAIPYDVVKVGSGYGSVFELLNAKSFSKLIAADPSCLDEVVGMYVELLKKIHSTEVGPDDMPDTKSTVLGWVGFLRGRLPEDKWEKLNNLVEAVPQNYHMLHGDYHVKNVMLQNGEALLIDMDTLSHGDPVFEFASIFNAYLGFSALDPSVSLNFLGLPHAFCEKIWDKTLRLYFGTDDEKKLGEVRDKASLIGFTRLMRRTVTRGEINTEQGKKNYDFYKNSICELLERVDDLKL